MTPTNIYDQLKRDEGVRLKAYPDTKGKITIGVGRNLTDVGISEAEANSMLYVDVVAAAGDLQKHELVAPNKNDVRFSVLLAMVFNMGISRFLGFKNMQAAYRAGDYATAAKEMLDSEWAKDPPIGVGQRAHRLAKQMETGEWQ